ncbi:MAG: arylsulfatase [Pirellulaceae bacterium]
MMRLLSVSLIIMCAGASSASEPPNVLLIMADDLGFSDIGCYGGEIATPNLDRLAAGGIRFTQFYNTGRCWPTRASLLTGFYPHQVGRDKVPGIRSGGRGQRPQWAPLVSVTLAEKGYRCYHSGKWHLDGLPLGNGFHSSYYLRDQHRFFNPTISFRDDVKLPPVKRESGFYGTTAIAEHMLQMLQGHHEKYADKPFFAYLAFTAPHFPLHAPAEDIKRNLERYQQGWEKIREARWKRIQQLGLVAGRLSAVESGVGSPYPERAAEAQKILGDREVILPLPWDQLSAEQKTFQAHKMAIHAAMVDRMDQEIGRVLAQLEKMSAIDNTLILFLSDNGASAEIMVRGDGHDAAAPMGSAGSHLCLGAGWSTTANTPFRRHKVWVHEGGIATPLIVHWPRGIKARGELRRDPGHVIDVVPTLRDVVGSEQVSQGTHEKGPRRPGRSLVPAFKKDGAIKREYLWWHHEGNRAIRMGNWKLVSASQDQAWSLYDLADDRTESRNRVADKPAIAIRLQAEWERRWQEIQEVARRGSGQ